MRIEPSWVGPSGTSPGASRASSRVTSATPRMPTRKSTLKVAQASEVAITSMMKPISSGSLIGVRKRTIDSAPSRPSDSGSENWMEMKIAVTASASSGKERWIWLPATRWA